MSLEQENKPFYATAKILTSRQCSMEIWLNVLTNCTEKRFHTIILWILMLQLN